MGAHEANPVFCLTAVIRILLNEIWPCLVVNQKKIVNSYILTTHPTVFFTFRVVYCTVFFHRILWWCLFYGMGCIFSVSKNHHNDMIRTVINLGYSFLGTSVVRLVQFTLAYLIQSDPLRLGLSVSPSHMGKKESDVDVNFGALNNFQENSQLRGSYIQKIKQLVSNYTSGCLVSTPSYTPKNSDRT